MNPTSEQLLYQLKSRGPQTAATLAQACGITTVGAHKQLAALQTQALVLFHDDKSGVGRPKRVWQLSPAGHARFPDRHGDLAVQLIRHAAELAGPELMDRLIAAREQETLVRYQSGLQGLSSLSAMVKRLAAWRAEEGYMARAEKDGRDWLLIEDHCPICAAATHCQGFCRSELELFRACLAGVAEVERSEHLVQGARRCVYRVRTIVPKNKTNN